MSEISNPYNGTNGNGYQPKSLPDNVVVSPPKHGSNARNTPKTQSLEELAKQCQKRGNRLEVMNGKVYEVSRKLIGTTE